MLYESDTSSKNSDMYITDVSKLFKGNKKCIFRNGLVGCNVIQYR